MAERRLHFAPDADGFDICKQLRAKTDAPVVILTARDSELDKVKGLEAGADDYIGMVEHNVNTIVDAFK